ncbi:hypothetical protein BHE74_00054034 [Ensete ventricosum]|nr:hypothetical protein BHE74_00054034 [Ensete ventricosum]
MVVRRCHHWLDTNRRQITDWRRPKPLTDLVVSSMVRQRLAAHLEAAKEDDSSGRGCAYFGEGGSEEQAMLERDGRERSLRSRLDSEVMRLEEPSVLAEGECVGAEGDDEELVDFGRSGSVAIDALRATVVANKKREEVKPCTGGTSGDRRQGRRREVPSSVSDGGGEADARGGEIVVGQLKNLF